MRYKSNFVFDLSGSLGGLTASRAKGGVGYFRERVDPTNPQTFLQTAIRSAVSSVSAAWKALSESNQISWWDIAPPTQQGKTLFSKVNQPRVYAQNTARVLDSSGDPSESPVAVIESAPEGVSTDAVFIGTSVIDDSSNTLQLPAIAAGAWNAGAGMADFAMVYAYVSGPQLPSQFSRTRPYQLVAAIQVDSDGAFTPPPINLVSFGIPTVAGRVQYVKYYVQSIGGAVSIPIQERVTVVA